MVPTGGAGTDVCPADHTRVGGLVRAAVCPRCAALRGGEIPAETVRVARAAFPRGSLAIQPDRCPHRSGWIATAGRVTGCRPAALPWHGRLRSPRPRRDRLRSGRAHERASALLSLEEAHDLLRLLVMIAQSGGPMSAEADRLAREVTARIPSET
ncbi:DUF6417 family protein [Streptomyces sp. NPDC046900]|uniref:DUF6417 family protein n=1 Tax=Streptomyces sp. NPDC046900 TaxID=3155473 RepID=UPI0033D9B3E4